MMTQTTTQQLAAIQPHLTALILRLTLALIVWPHGAQLMLGWFGGNGFSSTMGYFQSQGIPYPVAFTVIFLQFLGPFFLSIGLFTRLFALGIMGMFIGMIVTAHWPVGFFMNWTGALKGEGYEYHLLVLGICTALLVNGSGRFSLKQFTKYKTNQPQR